MPTRDATAYLFRIDDCRREHSPDSGDLEEMELVLFRPAELLSEERFVEMGVLSYVALVLLAQRRERQPQPPVDFGCARQDR
jgi:hypothetical protein